MKLPLIVFALLIPASMTALSVREALGQIESNNNDFAVGRKNERSRFQILPKVWKQFAPPLHFPNNQDEAWYVADRILVARQTVFETATGRKPTPAELYALWNAPGLFRKHGYRYGALPTVIRQRAERFQNLVLL